MTETAVEVKDATADKDTKEENNAKEQTTENDAGSGDANKTSENQTTEQPKAAAPPKGCRHPNFEKDVVYLFQDTRTPTIPSTSSSCLKVEAWLRLTGIKYENVFYKCKSTETPYVELNGVGMSDRTTIIQKLGEKFEKNLDAGLDNDQKNISHAMSSMIENHLSLVVNWWKAKYPGKAIKGYKIDLQKFYGTRVPAVIYKFFYKMQSSSTLKQLREHGIGLHTPEEIEQFGKNDLKVLSDTLGDKPFFFRDEPTNLDVIVFANVAQVYFVDKCVEYKLRDYLIESLPNLVGHVNRMKERCFPDWDDICKTVEPVAEKKEEKNEEEKKNEKEEAATEEKTSNDKEAAENKDKN